MSSGFLIVKKKLNQPDKAKALQTIRIFLHFLHLGQFSTGFYVFIAMMCFVVALFIVGLLYMIKYNCHCRVQCCFTCKEEEKEDINLDYGTYYSQDGERRENIMEVKVVISHHDESLSIQPQARDQNPDYDDYDYMESNMHNVVKENNPKYMED